MAKDSLDAKPEGHKGFSKGYTNRHGAAVSDACGEGNHAACQFTYRDCRCTYRGGHTTTHNYLNVPDTPPPTAAPEPPRILYKSAVSGLLYEKRDAAGDISAIVIGDTTYTLAAPAPTRPHRIGVWDYQSLCDCLQHNLEQAMPDYPYRDPQDAIQTLAARVMTLQRKIERAAQIAREHACKRCWDIEAEIRKKLVKELK